MELDTWLRFDLLRRIVQHLDYQKPDSLVSNLL